MKKIALAGPSITQKEIDYVIDAVKNGWYETYDMHIRKLEKTFADYVGAKYAIATYCGTHALHLACIAAGLKPGDEVVCTDQSYIATAMSISYVGPVPAFVDIRREDLCIDPDKIEAAITTKTKAIMLVHFAGFAADMDRIMEIAQKYDLKVIEDACQAVGVRYKNKYVGTIGDVGTYSFQGAKIAVGGEGGMLVTNNKKLYETAKHYGTFCRNDNISYLWSDDLGYNYRISNITAALILAQIERINELISMKKTISEWYHKELDDYHKIQILTSPAYCTTNYGYVVAYISDDSRLSSKEFVEYMLQNNIHFRTAYPSMSLMLDYERRFKVANSDYYFKKGVVFPTALNITENDVKMVCNLAKNIL